MPKLFTLQGRLSRIGYLKWSIVLMLLMIVFFLLIFGSFVLAADSNNAVFIIAPFLFLISAVLWGMVAHICITVRRLHDCGMPGLLSLLLFTGVGQILSIILLFIPGTQGDNQYGPAPESGY
ncbi:MAG: DUF805 domain-containing protein [Elusimicrobium sp.]|uniref:DUF805 domain-containing protein n=1 Tax=Candidatus Avelusimicrobium gallicola TaxID=2562704 RepID=A0A928DNR1_9BACT|nr:DUF805 domain-containing protein [Elusimicrobium sp.]